jgi:AsmA protein
LRKRIIGVVVLAISGVLILAVLNINFFVRRNKSYLIGRMERALGREVSVEEIDVTLWPLGARLINFTVVEDRAFSAGELFRAKVLRMRPRILPLLVGRVEINGMEIDSPLITIRRNAEGRYSFPGRVGKKNSRRATEHDPILSSTKQNGPLFLAASLSVSNGTLSYRDLETGRELTVTQIDLKTKGFESNEPIDIELEAAVMAAKPNLKFKSRIGPIAGIPDYRDVPIDGVIQADALDLGKINKAMPQLRKALPRTLRFDGIYTIQELKFKGTLNNLSLKGVVTGTDASFRFD